MIRRVHDDCSITKEIIMIWGRFKMPRVLIADMGIVVWFLSRLYTVGLPGHEPFSMKLRGEKLIVGPRLETGALLSAQEREAGAADKKASDGAEQATEAPSEEFLHDPIGNNIVEGVIGGEPGEMLEPPPPPEQEQTSGGSGQSAAGAEPGSEPPPDEFLQNPMADIPSEGVIDVETGEMIEPPPPPEQEQTSGDSGQSAAGAEPGSEPPPDEFLQNPMADIPSEGVIDGETGEMIEPPPPPEEQAATFTQPPADGETIPEAVPDMPPFDSLPGSEPDTVGPIITNETSSPTETEIPPPQ
jgi:hypothetical protein